MNYRLFASLTAAAALVSVVSCATPGWAQAGRQMESVAGSWRFSMNGPKPGLSQESLPAALSFSDTIALPGTTDTRKKGEAHGPGWNGALTRVYKFEGAAWYQRDVNIPAGWQNKRVTLFLERTKYTQVWLDDKPMGENTLITSPHEIVLGSVAPGSHRLTIMVDNSRHPVPGDMHQMSDNTQGNWNGIIGRMELAATDPVWINDVQVYPNAAAHSARIKVALGSANNQPGSGTLVFSVKGNGVSAKPITLPITWAAGGVGYAGTEVLIPMGSSAALWDEFHPNLDTLTVALQAAQGRDEKTVTFGLRDFATKGTQFAVNGQTTFLRGRHDACVFPLTGHPPMDVDGWTRYFRIIKSWGLNHVRFHTWTPPEAAFTAADQMGVYLQPELPFWGDFNEQIKTALEPEGRAILKNFGNHPSFVMFAMGNENRFSREVMGSLVSELRALDNRHLYAQGSNNFMWDPQLPPGDDYLTSARAKSGPQSPSRDVRGANAGSDGAAHIQTGPPNTLIDYSDAIAGIPRPVIGHEVGQYTVYPNFHEIPKYTGVMRADNFAYYQKKLTDAGMADQADDFFKASGELSALCYREEIESYLRTPGFGGFHLLDLQDFPGQGTALVGMLDAFMDAKGFITPEQWRQFCAPVVLLARFPKYTWTSGESFSADIEVAHYGEKDLANTALLWSLHDVSETDQNKSVASGKMGFANIEQGGVRPLTKIVTALPVTKPTRLNLHLELEGTSIQTNYPVWVYPAPTDATAPNGVTVARVFDAGVREKLQNGGRVVLFPDVNRPLARTVGGGFATDFWNFTMFHNKPGTMGLLCDPASPALAGFPTENHSNYEWFNIALHSQPLILDALPKGYRPLVQVIDNDERVHRLGLVFEVKVGAGRLLVCAADLPALAKEPEARQLLSSLLSYAGSDKFNPQTAVPADQIGALLTTTLPIKGKATASSSDTGWQQRKPEKVVDGNDYTDWVVGDKAASGTNPWWQIAFDNPQDLDTAEIVWGDERAGYKYLVEGTTDGTTWQTLSDQKNNTFPTGRHTVALHAKAVRALRITITEMPQNTQTGIREVRFLQPQ